MDTPQAPSAPHEGESDNLQRPLWKIYPPLCRGRGSPGNLGDTTLGPVELCVGGHIANYCWQCGHQVTLLLGEMVQKDVSGTATVEVGVNGWNTNKPAPIGNENGLHWSRDVTFNEDQSPIRVGNDAENAPLLCRLALSILKQDTRYSNSLRGKRLRAGWETTALEHSVTIFVGN